VSTRVGYTGGTEDAPTYHYMGDHSESVEIVFDPAVVTYDRLLDVFFAAHDPSSWNVPQYRSAIFVHDEAQRTAATAALRRWEAANRKAETAIEAAGTFTQAEDYHQKFYLRNGGPVWAEFHAMFPDTDDLVRSTAAARVNGWIGEGATSAVFIRGHLADVGLSEAVGEALIDAR
jgi:peptide-methionine (S)-S-oxide reductase